ncbi:MAG: extracellular solute-binding protein [Acetatifactor sp.]|nr:extracellular solute-binding protein [Acetatifactor sp.]
MKSGVYFTRLLIAFMTCFILAACSKGEGVTVVKKEEKVWESQIKYTGRWYEENTRDWILDADWIYDRDCLYTFEREYIYDGHKMTWEDYDEEFEDYSLLRVKTKIWKQKISDSAISSEECLFETDGYILEAVVTVAGDVWCTVMSSETLFGLENRYSLFKINANGKLLIQTLLDQQIVPGTLAVDGKENIALHSSGTLYFFNSHGKFCGKQELGNMLLALCGDRGEGFYFIELGEAGTNLKKLVGNKLIQIMAVRDDFYNLAIAGEGKVLVWNDTKLFMFSEMENSWAELCSWIDEDIFSDCIRYCGMSASGMITIYCVENRNERMIVLGPALGEESKRRELTIGVWKSSDALTRKVINFNRQNKECHVRIVEYGEKISGRSTVEEHDDAIDHMMLDYINDKGTDMLIVTSDIDIQKIAEGGLIEDLTDYLEKSANINSSDFFEPLLRQATYGKCLAYLPERFEIYTLLGKESVWGKRAGWTIDDMLEMAKKNINAYMLQPSSRDMRDYYQDGSLQIAILLNNWIFEANDDDQTNKDLLLGLLELTKKEYLNPDNLVGNQVLEAYDTGKIMAALISITDFTDLTRWKQRVFGKDAVCAIGYPTKAGEKGHVMHAKSGIAMLHNCKEKELAFSFMQYYVSDWEKEFENGFSAKRSIFDEQMKQVMDAADKVPKNGKTKEFAKEDLLLLMKIMEETDDGEGMTDQIILNIVSEEAKAFYDGEKAAEEVCNVIQNRVRLYISETDR